jgi:hypothetical protein
MSLDTFCIRPFTSLGRSTATISSAARHLSLKPEDGKQSRVLDKQGHSIELSPSTSTTSFTSPSMCCSGTLAVTSWISVSMLAPLKLSVHSFPPISTTRVLAGAPCSSFLRLQTAQSSSTLSICCQDHHLAMSLHQRTTTTSALLHTRATRGVQLHV